MTFQVETPSWLTSWVAWRNIYTEPGREPFNILRAELGVGIAPTGMAAAWQKEHEVCPHCNDMYVVNDDRWGLVYCVCQVLLYQERQYYKFEDIRSEITAASLSDLELTSQITPMGVASLKRAIAATEMFIKQPDHWLLFSGHYGTGKTHILRAVNSAFFPMSVYLASRDLEDMVHKYRKDDTLGDLYRLLRYAPVLILDDLGMEYGGPLMGSMVDRIVDARYARWPEYPIVAATNLPPAELPNYVPRTADRFVDLEKVVAIALKGSSYRTVSRSQR